MATGVVPIDPPPDSPVDGGGTIPGGGTAPINFPDAPAQGDTFSAAGKTWMRVGEMWVAYCLGVTVTDPPAPPGMIVCTSTTRPTGTPGLHIFETDTRRELFHDGTGWIISFEPGQPFTITPRQDGAAIPCPDQAAWVQRSNGWCDVHCRAIIGGPGTDAKPFDAIVDFLPPPMGGASLGAFTYYDASYGSYVGAASWLGSAIAFTTHMTNWTLGANPPFAAAATDVLTFTIRYRMNNLYQS
jgi:hypothetical protein